VEIGKLKLDNPVILAPMAGVTDFAFRQLVKEFGCGLVCAEMVSSKGLLYNNDRTVEMLAIHPNEKPISLQIFGSEPEIMARAAQIVEEKGADILDLNMGCPVPKVVKNQEGSALMRNPQLAGKIVQAVVKAVEIPVTVKMRKGWSGKEVNAVELAKIVEQAGAAAVAVHGRTREQYYSGQADWEIIKKVKEHLSIPVVGSGDVTTPQDARRMLEETGCDGVMIGRGALGNPWIFSRTIHYLRTGELLPPPIKEERLRVALHHFELLLQAKGEYIGTREMRKHAAWYTKGLPESAQLRKLINTANTKEELLVFLQG